MRWNSFRVADRLRMHVDDSAVPGLFGASRDGCILEIRSRAKRPNALVVALDEGLLVRGALLHQVLLTPRHRENVWTLLSTFLAADVSPVPAEGAAEAFEAALTIASVRKLRQRRGAPARQVGPPTGPFSTR